MWLFQNGRSISKRGVSCQFGPDVTERFLEQNKLQYIVRSHEVKAEGYEVTHSGKCITVFSAPNYWYSTPLLTWQVTAPSHAVWSPLKWVRSLKFDRPVIRRTIVRADILFTTEHTGKLYNPRSELISKSMPATGPQKVGAEAKKQESWKRFSWENI